ncbi:hypothetical protein [Dysgonomonas sp. 511]|uniref:hypothetical protein n=1 Tax=Dysgonomonas sp. 511 TaxID=2302930 RepID=UPI0013D546A4|nr:hypothetical protein [Dysgonomonas sp. 511]NDV79596.1 hypothetical protein [Dysgonomonas sp. 511]
MNHKQLTYILGLILIALFGSDALQAQVTIGSGARPLSGALLQLKENESEGSNAYRGLLLPRVRLVSRATSEVYIAGAGDNSSQEMFSTGSGEAHNGFTVFNITENPAKNLCGGVYTWTKGSWLRLQEPCEYVCPATILNVTAPPSICGATEVSMTATTLGADYIYWYENEYSDTPLHTTKGYVSRFTYNAGQEITDDLILYVSAYSETEGCESLRQPVYIHAYRNNPYDAITVTADKSKICRNGEVVTFTVTGVLPDLAADTDNNYSLIWYRQIAGNAPEEFIPDVTTFSKTGDEITRWTSEMKGWETDLASVVATSAKYFVRLEDKRACNVTESNRVSVDVDQGYAPRIILRDCHIAPLGTYVEFFNPYYYLPDTDLDGKVLNWFYADGTPVPKNCTVGDLSGYNSETNKSSRKLFFTRESSFTDDNNLISTVVENGRVTTFYAEPVTSSSGCSSAGRVKFELTHLKIPHDKQPIYTKSSVGRVNQSTRKYYPQDEPSIGIELTDISLVNIDRSWIWTVSGDDLGNMPVSPKEGALYFPGFIPTQPGKARFHFTSVCEECARPIDFIVHVFDNIETTGGAKTQELCPGASMVPVTLTSTKYKIAVERENWHEDGITGANFKSITVAGDGTTSVTISGKAPEFTGKNRMGSSTITLRVINDEGLAEASETITIRWGDYICP